MIFYMFFFFQAEDGIRDYKVTGVQTCALPICIAPKAAEYGAITSEAPVNCRMRKRAGSTNGIGDRKQRHTNSARRTIAAATATLILGGLHTQSFTFTIANTSAPMPPVTSAASHALGLGAS